MKIFAIIFLVILLTSCSTNPLHTQHNSNNELPIPAPLFEATQPQAFPQQEVNSTDLTPTESEFKEQCSEAGVEPQPKQDDPTLADSQLVRYDGMVYRYVGESNIFRPAGWGISITIPEEWKESTVLFCTHPDWDEITIIISSTELMHTYVSELGQDETGSYYDYAVRICGISQDNQGALEYYRDQVEHGYALLLGETSDFQFFAQTNSSQDPTSQEACLKALLIEKIGIERYQLLSSSTACTLSESADLFQFTPN